MFSVKHFSWKKLLLCIVLVYIFSLLTNWLVYLAHNTLDNVFTTRSLLKRLLLSVFIGILISFMDYGPKKN